MRDDVVIDRQDFQRHLTSLNLPFSQQKILVAVSGGADSICLCLLLKELNFDIIAATVNHNLRPQSRAEAEQVTAMLALHGINHVILDWHFTTKPQSKIQELARQARFNLLANYALIHNINFLFLGHNQDDQAETFIFRLCKGSGLDGLTGIKPITVQDQLTIVRPLLIYPRTQVEATLQASNQDWINDPSNQDSQYTRVRLRQIIQAFRCEGLTPASIAQAITKLETARQCLDTQALNIIKDHCQLNTMGYIVISSQHLNNLCPELQYRVVQKILKAIGGKYYPPKRNQLVCLINRLKPGKNSKAFTFGGCCIISRSEEIYFLREESGITANNLSPEGTWDRRFVIKNAQALQLDIKALGYKGYCLVPVELRQPNVPFQAHFSLPAIWQEQNLVAVPHLNYFPRPELLGREENIEIKFRPKFL